VRELYETERSYVRNISTLVKVIRARSTAHAHDLICRSVGGRFFPKLEISTCAVPPEHALACDSFSVAAKEGQ